MPIDAVDGYSGLEYVGTPKKEDNAGLSADTNTFLTLLVAQMQYQDPLEPKKDSDFVAQLAQLTSLEQLQMMNASMETSQAYGLVGKNIYAEILNPLTGVTEVYAGVVDSIAMQSGMAYAVVGDTAIAIGDIVMVSDEPFIPQKPGDEGAPEVDNNNAAGGEETLPDESVGENEPAEGGTTDSGDRNGAE